MRSPLHTIIQMVAIVTSISPSLSLPSHQPTWTTLANITLAPRQEHSTVYLPPSTIGILGGIVPDPNSLALTTDIMQFYSISNNTWQTKAPMPRALNHVNAAVSGGKIYVLGGLAETNETPPAWRAVPDSFVYDPKTNEWKTITPLPTSEARGSAAMGVHDGKIFLAGGMRALVLVENGLQDSVDTVSIYDTAKDQWIAVPEAAKRIPGGRDHAGAAVVGDKFYVLGGRDHGQLNVKDTVFVLNLNDVRAGWTTRSGRMPTPRGGIAAGVVGRKVYTFGGEGNLQVPSGVFNQTEAYDTVTDTWERLPPMKIPRHGTYAVGVGKHVYIPGGGVLIGAGPVTDFTAFTP